MKSAPSIAPRSIIFDEQSRRPVRAYDIYVDEGTAEWLNLPDMPRVSPQIIDHVDAAPQPYYKKGPKAVYDPKQEESRLAGQSADTGMNSDRAQQAITLIADFVTAHWPVKALTYDFDVTSVPKIECSPEHLFDPDNQS